MELLLERLSSGGDDTLGVLFRLDETGPAYKNVCLCFTLEDQFQATKVMHETRIPAGRYQLKLRTVGGTHEKYAKLFPTMHLGMLWLQNVPGFEYILVHIGNTDEDTDGCILVGDDMAGNFAARSGSIARSRDAYCRIYPPIAAALKHNEEVWLTVVDRG